jgi:hypothetical protein
MNPFFFVAILLLALGCGRVKEGTKEAINKTGEVAGKATTTFAQGVEQGVQSATESKADLAPNIAHLGVSTGKLLFTEEAGANDNILSIYLIFENNFSGLITVKAFDKEDKEYGRTSLQVTAKKGDAGYYDFVFDKRVNLESKSRFLLQ